MATKSKQLQIRVTPSEKAQLRRLARGAGQDLSSYVLSKALPLGEIRFAELLRELRRADADAGGHGNGDGDRDRDRDRDRDACRFALAELNDFLSALAPAQLRDSVRHAEIHELSPLMQNYVAAMVEQAAYLKGVEPPSWTRQPPALDEPYFATSLRSLRPHLLRASPVPFKRRNIFVDATVGGRV